MLHSIHSNYCTAGPIVEEKTLDGDGSVVDGLIWLTSEFISNFAAVAVNAVTNSIDEAVLLSIHFNYRKVFDIFVYRKGTVVFWNHIPGKVIAASHRIVENSARYLQTFSVVYESVEGSVSPRDDETVAVSDGSKKGFVVSDGWYVYERALFIWKYFFHLQGSFLALAIAGKGII